MDFKDVKDDKDWKKFVSKHFKQLDDPKRFVEVLKKAWGKTDEQAEANEFDNSSLIWKHPLRSLFPNYTPPRWDKIRLIDYPLESTEHPFDPKSLGKYFIYLSNRTRSISYLGNNISDFSQSKLIECIEMGRASLSVMQRVLLVLKSKEEYQWKPETNIRDMKRDKFDNKIFCLFDPNGQLDYANTEDYVAKDTSIKFKSFENATEFSRKIIDESDYPILCGLRLHHYQWH